MHCAASPSFSLWCAARDTWYALMVTPVTAPPEVAAIVRIGPPTPHPTSSADLPGSSPISAAMRPSWAASQAAQSLPGRRGEKWKEVPQPHSYRSVTSE